MYNLQVKGEENRKWWIDEERKGKWEYREDERKGRKEERTVWRTDEVGGRREKER